MILRQNSFWSGQNKVEKLIGKNPQTGAAIKIPASKAPKFKAGKALKDLVNKK